MRNGTRCWAELLTSRLTAARSKSFLYPSLVSRAASTFRPWTSPRLILPHLLQQLGDICTHTDLLDTGLWTQQQAEPTQEAEWDIKTSSKFAFLHGLLEAALALEKHIVLVSKQECWLTSWKDSSSEATLRSIAMILTAARTRIVGTEGDTCCQLRHTNQSIVPIWSSV
ncbi:hypothetical protein MRB53_041363 [Persea americana]|nr:hypothetical protein MRB53_041363 [Persea americana]